MTVFLTASTMRLILSSVFCIRDRTIGILGNTNNDDILVTCYSFIKTKTLTTFLYEKCENLEQWKLKNKGFDFKRHLTLVELDYGFN